MDRDPKNSVLVCQRGARHRYAIPRILEQEGMLAALYTDSTAHSRIGKLATALSAAGMASGKINALIRRIPVSIPPEKIISFDRPILMSFLRNEMLTDLGSSFIRKGLRGAEIIYSMYGEDFPFLEWAKLQGCKIAVDVFIHPDTFRIVSEESLRCIGRAEASQSMIDRHRAHSRLTFDLADILVCPSEWVAAGVRGMFPEYAGKVRIVPYGSSLDCVPSINAAPQPGRILFAGREPLRKGLHYLAEAAHHLRAKGVHVDVHVAGITTGELDWMEYRDELNCLGTLPMDAMQDEFRQAEVCVLPSLSEGQAGVILEAMSCGCPVIATRESGVDFEAGCGITVPVCDAVALADAIGGVLEDRQKRNALAKGALRQSAAFSMDAWRDRLTAMVREMAASNAPMDDAGRGETE